MELGKATSKIKTGYQTNGYHTSYLIFNFQTNLIPSGIDPVRKSCETVIDGNKPYIKLKLVIDRYNYNRTVLPTE